MQSIEYNKEIHLMLNKICDIPAGLKNQRKRVLLYKVLAHIRILGNEEAAKPNISEITIIKLSYKQKHKGNSKYHIYFTYLIFKL